MKAGPPKPIPFLCWYFVNVYEVAYNVLVQYSLYCTRIIVHATPELCGSPSDGYPEKIRCNLAAVPSGPAAGCSWSEVSFWVAVCSFYGTCRLRPRTETTRYQQAAHSQAPRFLARHPSAVGPSWKRTQQAAQWPSHPSAYQRMGASPLQRPHSLRRAPQQRPM